MVNATVVTNLVSQITTRLGWAWNWSGQTWTNSAGSTLYIAPTQYLSYSGGAMVFILAMIGALEVSSKTVYWIEQGLNDFNYIFSSD